MIRVILNLYELISSKQIIFSHLLYPFCSYVFGRFPQSHKYTPTLRKSQGSQVRGKATRVERIPPIGRPKNVSHTGRAPAHLPYTPIQEPRDNHHECGASALALAVDCCSKITQAPEVTPTNFKRIIEPYNEGIMGSVPATRSGRQLAEQVIAV